MTSERHMSTVCASLEGYQELLKKKIDKLATTLIDGKGWAGEIGDQLVYLKFYAANSFQTEKEVMLRHGFSAYDAHREQHEGIAGELRRLLELIVRDDTPMSLITDASSRLLHRLQSHIAQHDSQLLDFVGKGRQQPDPVHRKEARRREFGAAFSGGQCYTA